MKSLIFILIKQYEFFISVMQDLNREGLQYIKIPEQNV